MQELSTKKICEIAEEKDLFFTNIMALANLCGITLAGPVLRIYDLALSEFGYRALNKAVERFIMNRDSRDAFPSVNEFRKVLGAAEPSSLGQAREAAALIIATVSRFGSIHSAKDFQPQREHMGELAWQVCKHQGGYQAVCDLLTPQNTPTYQAQWRDLALALIERNTIEEGKLELKAASENKMLAEALKLAAGGIVDMGKVGDGKVSIDRREDTKRNP